MAHKKSKPFKSLTIAKNNSDKKHQLGNSYFQKHEILAHETLKHLKRVQEVTQCHIKYLPDCNDLSVPVALLKSRTGTDELG